MANDKRRGEELSERFVEFAVASLELADRLPNDYVSQHVMRQLTRSATAPGALYEEARRAESGADFIHKLRVAAKEVGEALYWLRVLKRRVTLPGATYEPLLDEASQLLAILLASISTASQNTRKRR